MSMHVLTTTRDLSTGVLTLMRSLGPVSVPSMHVLTTTRDLPTGVLTLMRSLGPVSVPSGRGVTIAPALGSLIDQVG